MTVDDPGLRRQHRGHAIGMRLEPLGRRSVDHLHVLAAVYLGLLENLLDAGGLLVVGGNDELAALLVRDAMRGAVIVKHPARTRAVHRTPGPGGIIEPGV